MKRILIACVAVLVVALFTLLIPGASAQCYVNGEEVPCGTFMPGMLGIGFLTLGVIIPLVAVVVLSVVFWLLMLIDCLQRDFEDKLVWVLVLLFLTLLGAILYYFLVKRKERPRGKRRK